MASPLVFLDVVPYESAFRWRNDPKIYRWCRQPTTQSIHKHNTYWECTENSDANKMYGIYKDGLQRADAVGVCGLTSIDFIAKKAEFSLYIATEFQGNGYARDALVELFARGFHELGLNRIWGETFEGNVAYQLFKDIGMKDEGTLRHAYFKDGKLIDSRIVSILRKEWDELHSTAYMRHVIHNTSRRSLDYNQGHHCT